MGPTLRGAEAPLKVGDHLPTLSGELLTKRPITLPQDTAGTHAVLFLGFTYASRTPVEAWGGWFKDTFGSQPHLTYFEVPVIGGAGRLARWFIDSGMRRGTPAALHEHVITVYHDVGAWKARLGVDDTNDKDAFVVVVDATGRVAWSAHGPFTRQRADDLKAFLADVTS